MTTDIHRDEKRLTILVVEDTRIHQRLFRDNLHELNADCIVAEDGLEALEAMRERLPDLIVLDLAMPRMDGFELLRSIKADPRTAGIPVLVVTAHGQSGTAKEVTELGADLYVEKPVPRQKLVDIAISLLGLTPPDGG